MCEGGKYLFGGGEKNWEGKGGEYLEKENIFFWEEKEKEGSTWEGEYLFCGREGKYFFGGEENLEGKGEIYFFLEVKRNLEEKKRRREILGEG